MQSVESFTKDVWNHVLVLWIQIRFRNSTNLGLGNNSWAKFSVIEIRLDNAVQVPVILQILGSIPICVPFHGICASNSNYPTTTILVFLRECVCMYIVEQRPSQETDVGSRGMTARAGVADRCGGPPPNGGLPISSGFWRIGTVGHDRYMESRVPIGGNY